MRAPSLPKQVAAVVDQSTYLVDRNDVLSRVCPRSTYRTNASRIRRSCWRPYKKDPEAFLQEYAGSTHGRSFLMPSSTARTWFASGHSADGGKWVSDPQSLKTGAVVYSFGAGTRSHSTPRWRDSTAARFIASTRHLPWCVLLPIAAPDNRSAGEILVSCRGTGTDFPRARKRR